MLSRINGVVWMGDDGDEEDAVSWTRANAGNTNVDGTTDGKDELGLPSLKSMLDDDWYIGTAAGSDPGGGSETSVGVHHPFEAFQAHQELKNFAFPSNSSPSPHEALLLPSVVDNLDQNQQLFAPKSAVSSLFGAMCSNPFDATAGFDVGCDALAFLPAATPAASNSSILIDRSVTGANLGGLLGFGGMGSSGEFGVPNLSSGAPFSAPRLLLPVENCSGSSSGGIFNPMSFDMFDNSPFFTRSKVLRPLEIFPPVGTQPTLFQKRAAAAFRQNSAVPGGKGINFELCGSEGAGQPNRWKASLEEDNEKKRIRNEEDEMDDGSIGSGLNYDSEDTTAVDNAKGEETAKNGSGGGNNSNANSTVTGTGGEQKGKKGLPAKNLMAERRRRKKLNDRLYMLRSVVPKISKMDRASILGDAIEYLKELLQRINDLHNELESTPSSSSLPASTTTSFHPLTPTPASIPSRVKEELCPSSFPSPSNQPAKVEVRIREGRAVNIHMFCTRKPGLLLSTMRALDGMGLDVQQAVISCFNGFALDVFRAEQCKEGPGVLAEEIKSVLLHSAGFPSPM